MPRSRHDLTAGEWAVLALLAEAPSHGFALARAMAPDGDVGRVWSRPPPARLPRRRHAHGDGPRAPRRDRREPDRPARTILEATPNGKRAVTRWLGTPVEHVRDGRSLLMLKLLFLARRDADPSALLGAQREVFTALAVRLTAAADAAEGFDRALALWRLESTTAALRFVETMLHAPVPSAMHGAHAGGRAFAAAGSSLPSVPDHEESR